MFVRLNPTLLILLSVQSFLPAPGQTSYQTVKTKYGSVRGKVETRGTIQIKTFKGIPFAAAPVKNLRFMPPVTVSPWKEVLNADRFAPVCPQDFPDVTNTSAALQRMSKGRLKYLRKIAPALENQSEDCLYLNVYIPISGGEASRLPVVLLIHGPDYSWGSGNLHDGSALAAFGNILVVTINYRLGVLGFLNVNSGSSSGGAPSVPSNLGILDQIAALHWIQENIQDFGGDKKNVTVIGHGRGAACLHFLVTSDALPHGLLFRRVILMSGSAVAPWARSTTAEATSRSLAAALDCQHPNQPHLVVECLRKVTLSSLLDQATKLHSQNRFATLFGPSYDGIVVHSFKNKVGEYLERMARYDMMLGVTSAEGFIHLSDEELELGLETEGRNRLVSELVTSTYHVHQKEIFSAILTEYTDWSRVSRQPISTRDITVEAVTDGLYVSPGIETADYHASLNKNSWFYVFDYQTKFGNYPQRVGCVHGEELAYILGYPLLGDYYGNYSRSEQNLAELVMTYWTNFIISGNPNFPHTTEREGAKGKFSGMVDWSPYDPTYKKYLQIGPKLKIKDQFRARRVALWLNLVPDLVHSGTLEKEQPPMEHYLTYQETLPFIPSIKDISLMKDKSRPALLESLESHPSASLSPPAMIAVTPATSHNESLFGLEGSLSSYSTALSVTIAIGTSLLILNILIFAAVYYQRDKNKMGSRYSLSVGSDPAPVNLTQPVGSHPPSLSGSLNVSARTPQSRRQSCRLSYSGAPSSAYMPPPQFADGQNSDCSDTFSMAGSGHMGISVMPMGISTLPRRCHQPMGSDTQPLIIGTSFRTLPRQQSDGSNPFADKTSLYPTHNDGSKTSHYPENKPGTQTLPLKSSLKKPVSRAERNEPKLTGSMEELRV